MSRMIFNAEYPGIFNVLCCMEMRGREFSAEGSSGLSQTPFQQAKGEGGTIKRHTRPPPHAGKSMQSEVFRKSVWRLRHPQTSWTPCGRTIAIAWPRGYSRLCSVSVRTPPKSEAAAHLLCNPLDGFCVERRRRRPDARMAIRSFANEGNALGDDFTLNCLEWSSVYERGNDDVAAVRSCNLASYFLILFTKRILQLRKGVHFSLSSKRFVSSSWNARQQ